MLATAARMSLAIMRGLQLLCLVSRAQRQRGAKRERCAAEPGPSLVGPGSAVHRCALTRFALHPHPGHRSRTFISPADYKRKSAVCLWPCRKRNFIFPAWGRGSASAASGSRRSLLFSTGDQCARFRQLCFINTRQTARGRRHVRRECSLDLCERLLRQISVGAPRSEMYQRTP